MSFIKTKNINDSLIKTLDGEEEERLILVEKLKNISAACKATGFSRDSYYRIRKAYEQGGEAALRDKRLGTQHLKVRIPGHMEEAVIDCSLEHPTLGKQKVSQMLK